MLIGPDSDVGRAMGGLLALPAAPHPVQTLAGLSHAPRNAGGKGSRPKTAGPGEPLSTAHAVRMLKLAAEHGVPAVLSNAVRYVAEDGAATADVLETRPDAESNTYSKPGRTMPQHHRQLLLDGGDVGIDEHRSDALLLERLDGLCAGIVDLSGLADLQGARAEDEHSTRGLRGRRRRTWSPPRHRADEAHVVVEKEGRGFGSG